MKEQKEIRAGVDSFTAGRRNEQGSTRKVEGKEGERTCCEKGNKMVDKDEDKKGTKAQPPACLIPEIPP